MAAELHLAYESPSTALRHEDENHRRWKRKEAARKRHDILVPSDSGQMQFARCNPIVNKARNETPACLEPD